MNLTSQFSLAKVHNGEKIVKINLNLRLNIIDLKSCVGYFKDIGCFAKDEIP